ncbi:unnamed protein product [Phyllotreta striolata]|uniref:Methionine aminopeptidase n=1 Tax=Phyllotreta striolata TaxID=444603 RepID=A0A9N9XL45_PHYSR|nr:unnamed protein product [Phyllotreta striolata]
MPTARYFIPVRNFFWQKKPSPFGNYEIVSPGKVTVNNAPSIPKHIPKPSYHIKGVPNDFIPSSPEIKSPEQIRRMTKSCQLAANVLKRVEDFIQVGKTTEEIDRLVFNSCMEIGVYPSPLNYRHFPKSVCTSVNNVACHGIPDDRPLQNGDIINVDITVFHDGFHGDCSKTFLIGDVDEQGKKLVEATKECLHAGIELCRPGASFREIGCRIEEKATSSGFNIISAFIGHGIGSYFHGPPDIYHIANVYPGVMAAGMTFTIEPILTEGEDGITILNDDWTAVTVDDARTAQFEHTVLITDSGVEILTECK